MKNPLLVLWFVLVMLVLAGSALQPQGPSAVAPGNKEEIDQLIRQLSSTDFKLRDQATRKLKEMDEALPALRVAAQSADLETRQRAEQIILVLKGRPLRKLVVDGNIQVIDQFVDQLWASKELLNDDHWATVVKFANDLLAWGKKQPRGKYLILMPDFHHLIKLPVMVKDHHKTDGGRVAIYGQRILTGKLEYDNLAGAGLIICNGPVRFVQTQRRSVILANGNIDVYEGARRGCLAGCIVVCDGDIHLDYAASCVLIATGKIQARLKDDSVWMENAPNPLPVGKFFEPAMAGIDVSGAGEEVRVEKVHDGKRFAKAGVRKGDQLVALGDAKVTSADVFRRLLRRAVVERGERVFKILRAGKTIEVKVLF